MFTKLNIKSIVLFFLIFGLTNQAQALRIFDLSTCQEVEILDRDQLRKPIRFRQDLMDDMIQRMPASCWFGKDDTKKIKEIIEEEEGIEPNVYLSPIDQLIYFGVPVVSPFLWIQNS